MLMGSDSKLSTNGFRIVMRTILLMGEFAGAGFNVAMLPSCFRSFCQKDDPRKRLELEHRCVSCATTHWRFIASSSHTELRRVTVPLSETACGWCPFPTPTGTALI